MNRPIEMTHDAPVLVRPSRDSDVEAMLAIYRYHVRHGVPRDVEGTGAAAVALSLNSIG